MKANIFKRMVTFQLIRRGNWLMKISVLNDKNVMVVAKHYFNSDVVIRYFANFEVASNWVEWLIEQENI